MRCSQAIAYYRNNGLLKPEHRSFSGGSRPRTPPLPSHSTSSSRSNSTTTQLRPGSGLTSPPRSYTPFTARSNDGWSARDESDEDDQEEEEDDEVDFTYDDDEDEFGLPSIASMQRKGKRKPPDKASDTVPAIPSFDGGLSRSNQNALLPEAARRRANSTDIGDERGAPAYPSAQKKEGKILRPQYKEILRGESAQWGCYLPVLILGADPGNSMHLISHKPLPANAPPKLVEANSARISRINKFKRILQASTVSVAELRDSAWSGIPEEVRAMTWQLLLGYLPVNGERRVVTLERKRKEYLDGVRQAFERGLTGSQGIVQQGLSGATIAPTSNSGRGRGLDEAIWHQISIDVPRTNPHLELYGYEATQRSLERILYVWAIRHPASGYVQGINDLVTPFWQVFLGAYITDSDIESGMDPGQLPKPVLDAVEADSFWCLTKLLDGIQDNYIFAQPGIQRQVGALRDLTTRIDSGLAKHLEREGVEFIQFSFRWMNCLLMREFSIRNTIRMWDTYMVRHSLLNGEVFANFPKGRRARLFGVPFVCLCSFSSEMVGAASKDGLPRSYDVPASAPNARMDGKGHRAVAERSVHLAEPFPRVKRSSEGSWPLHVIHRIDRLVCRALHRADGLF